MKKVLFLMRLKEPNNEYTTAVFNWFGPLEHLGYEVHYYEYNNYNPDSFYEYAKSLKPDFIFHPTYENFHPEFIKLREFSKVYCIHSDDDWRFENFAKYWIPFTDGSIGYQNSTDSYIKVGADKNYYYRARWAFNPNTMVFNFNSEKIYGLSHIGVLHGNKAQKLKYLQDSGMHIDQIELKSPSYSSYMETYHRSIASVCFTNNSLGTASQSKTRLAEMPYYCVLISEPWPNIEMWNMEPNVDFVLLDGSSNSIELINKLLGDKDFAQNMYKRSKDILINKNTVYHEWDKIMQQIDEDYKKVDVNYILKQFNL